MAQVARANAAIDAHMESLHERTGQLRTSGLYGRESTKLAGDGSTGRFDMGGMLGWAKPHCASWPTHGAPPHRAPSTSVHC